MSSRAALLAVVAGVGLVLPGCFGTRGVDFSVDQDYRFDHIRRVAIVAPAGRAEFVGLADVLVDAAAQSLAPRYRVYYGNGLARLVAAAGVTGDYQMLREEMLGGQAIDGTLVARVGKALGVDAFFLEEIASLDQFVESGTTTSTVAVDRQSGYGTITQNPTTTVTTTVRLGARLYDAATGWVVWSGSKVESTAGDIAQLGFTPLFRTADRDFLATIPSAGPAASPVPTSRQVS